jgi:hypothetical protein
MDGKIEQHVCMKFRLKLSKSATDTLEMLHEEFEEHSLNPSGVFFFQNGIHISRLIEWQLKMMNVTS